MAQKLDIGITPGAVWHDTDGALIQAHGGGVLKHGNTWYFYGEDKRNGYFPSPGVSCYSSTNLVNWKNEGVVCPVWIQDGRSMVPNTPEKFQNSVLLAIGERPKVIYNERTKKFVMWIHLEGHIANADIMYQISTAGVAVSDTPTGPFEYVNFLRPVSSELHKLHSDNRTADQFERGSTFRDMTLFKDDDGTAYVIYASEGNLTMHIATLTEDYCDVVDPVLNSTWSRVLVDEHREAPALFKHAGKYYLVTSGCEGWAPTEALLSVSNAILGPYTNLGNPCRGKDANRTFGAQSTFILPVDREKGRFIFMADQWTPKNLKDSRYMWLPFVAKEDEAITIHWQDHWIPSL